MRCKDIQKMVKELEKVRRQLVEWDYESDLKNNDVQSMRHNIACISDIQNFLLDIKTRLD